MLSYSPGAHLKTPLYHSLRTTEVYYGAPAVTVRGPGPSDPSYIDASAITHPSLKLHV